MVKAGKKTIRKPVLVFCLLALIIGAEVVFLWTKNRWLIDFNSIIQTEFDWTRSAYGAALAASREEAARLGAELEAARNDLAIAIAQRDNIGLQYNEAVDKYNQEKNRVDELDSQIGQIKGSVDVLEKLKATDEELLKKYSKVAFLNENYIPESFSAIDPQYVYNPDENYLVYSKIWPFLKILMATAAADGIDIKIISAYRSFGQQGSLKSAYKMVYGSGANQFSADQGYSEHQLGTAVDFTTDLVGGTFEGFEKTPAFDWLENNAYQFGFILSYPENNGYYQYEPWHWRFVGRRLAQKLHEEGKNFYNLDQREIDQYLISFFD